MLVLRNRALNSCAKSSPRCANCVLLSGSAGPSATVDSDFAQHCGALHTERRAEAGRHALRHTCRYGHPLKQFNPRLVS